MCDHFTCSRKKILGFPASDRQFSSLNIDVNLSIEIDPSVVGGASSPPLDGTAVVEITQTNASLSV